MSATPRMPEIAANETAGPRRFAVRGTHPVGVTTLEADDPNHSDRRLPIEVWYPAAAEYAGVDEQRDAQDQHPLGRPHRAVRGAKPIVEECPLLLFSHGNSGLRQQSTFLTTHLASWGFVVAAPDHTGNTFAEMQGLDEEQRKVVHIAARENRPRDLSLTLDRVVEAAAVPPIATECVGAFGHSFGGWTALKMPRQDSRVRAVCSLAPAAEPFVGRRAFVEGELPLAGATPALLIAGLDDVLVDIEDSVASIFQRLRSPRAMVGIRGADHFHFCDGISLLHTIHRQTPRAGLKRPVRLLSELLDEATTHAILQELVTHYFFRALIERIDPCAPFVAGTTLTLPHVEALG